MFAAGHLASASVASYLANLRTVERCLGIDLDSAPLAADHIRAMRDGLRQRHIPAARASDCASALRLYAAFRSGSEPLRARRHATIGAAQREPALACRAPEPKSAFIAETTVGDLMQLYADILAELRQRGVMRSGNGPTGEYAELLFQRAFG